MLMVIFGAGASYDSAQAFPVTVSPPSGGNGGPWRPPLASDLFRDRDEVFGGIIRKYNQLRRILPYLRDPVSSGSVEQTLESFQEQGKAYPERQRELAAVKFYLADLLIEITEKWDARTNGITNYAALVDEILRLDKSEEVCLVTFNYDLLLERALVGYSDFKMKEPDNFLSSHPKLKIFRLHGSVNWSRTVGTEGAIYSPTDIVDRADSLLPSDRFVWANAARPDGRYGSLYPAVAIPVQNKMESHFECPLAHLTYLRAMLPSVTKVLIIGWQAREAHFTGMVRQHLGKLTHVMVVGRDKADSARVLQYFLEQISQKDVPNTFFGQGGFTRFIVTQEGERFFRE